MQEFNGEAAYVPFHDTTFKQQVAQSSLQQLSVMQQMLDWRETEVRNEVELLDSAEKSFSGDVHTNVWSPMQLVHVWLLRSFALLACTHCRLTCRHACDMRCMLIVS